MWSYTEQYPNTDPTEVALHRFDLLTNRCVKMRGAPGEEVVCGKHRYEIHQATIEDVDNLNSQFSCHGRLTISEFYQIVADRQKEKAKRDRAFDVAMEIGGRASYSKEHDDAGNDTTC